MINIDLKTPTECKGCKSSEVRYLNGDQYPYAYCTHKEISIHGLTDRDEKPCKVIPIAVRKR